MDRVDFSCENGSVRKLYQNFLEVIDVSKPRGLRASENQKLKSL